MSRDTSFSYSFVVLPAEQRHAIGVVWDFCRAVDDAVDEEPVAATATLRVAEWRAEVARVFSGEPPQTAQGRNLQPFVERFHLSREPFDELVDGVEMDLHHPRYETFDELVEYCKRVASAVGVMCIEIFGCRDPQAREYATHLGLALQITNIIRDVKDDLSHGRVYLPAEDLRRFGCSEADLAAGVVTAPVQQLLRFECKRAREQYTLAAAGDAARLRPQAGRRRDHGRHLLRDPAAHRAERLRRVLVTDPRAEAGARVHRDQHLHAQPLRHARHASGTRPPHMTPDVIVIGAGCAGLAAATALVEDGARVLVLEGRPTLGGRASAVRDAATGEKLDNGQHVLMGCYDATLAFLHRIGASDRVRRQSGLAMTMVEETGRQSRLQLPPLPAPLHLLAGVLAWDALSWSEKLSVMRVGSVITGRPASAAPDRSLSRVTVRDWLRAHGQAPRLVGLFWEPLALGALNQAIDEAAAVTFVEVLSRMFGPDAERASLVVPAVPLDELYAEPAREWLEARGSEVRTKAMASVRRERRSRGRCGRARRGDRRAHGDCHRAVVRDGAAVRHAAAFDARCAGARRRYRQFADRHGEPVVRPPGAG